MSQSDTIKINTYQDSETGIWHASLVGDVFNTHNAVGKTALQAQKILFRNLMATLELNEKYGAEWGFESPLTERYQFGMEKEKEMSDKAFPGEIDYFKTPDIKTAKCAKCGGSFKENEPVQFQATWSYGEYNGTDLYHEKCWQEVVGVQMPEYCRLDDDDATDRKKEK